MIGRISMKLFVISQYFWPENFTINSIATSLVNKNYKIKVITGKPNYPTGVMFNGYKALGFQNENYKGVEVQRIPLLPRGRNVFSLAINYFSFVLSGLLFMPWLLRKEKSDVIFVYGVSPILQAIPAIYLGWLKNVPVVLWVQDLWPESLSATGYVTNKYVLKIVEYIVRFIYKRVDLLLVQSEAFIGPVSELAPGTPIKYFPNSVDVSFTQPTDRQVTNLPGLDAPFSILFAGNIGTAQAVEVILEAATLLKDQTEIQFVLLGDGSRRNWMINEAKNRGLENLQLPGKFPVEDMPVYMQKATALLVTLSDKKIFSKTIPNKVQAYMASGRPILASINGETARVVTKSGAGIATPAENSGELAHAILKLVNMNASERDKMGSNGKKYFKAHFDHDQLVEQLIILLKSAKRKI